MPNKLKMFVYSVCILMLTGSGCVLPSPPKIKAYPEAMVWNGLTKNHLFNVTLDAIRDQGLSIDADISSKDAHLIVTRPMREDEAASLSGASSYSYQYSILITDGKRGAVRLSVSVPWTYEARGLLRGDQVGEIERSINRQVSAELHQLARRIEAAVGQPIAMQKNVLRAAAKITLVLAE